MIISNSHLSDFLAQSVYADFNFGTVGDWGCNSNTKSTVNNLKAKSPERVLALGDYSYQPTAKCWLDTIKDIKTKTRINIGNHEYDGNGPSQYLNAFGLNSQYYSFNYANTHVLTMATELSFKKGSSQYNFVDNDLKTAAADPNIKWIIVNYHKLMYTSPNTCSSSSCKGSSTLRDTYHPLFDKYGVDLVLQAHVHNYQRTFPLKYNTNSHSNPTKTSTGTSTYTDPQGEIFATVGTGGINFHGLSGKSSFVVKQQAQKFGILDIRMADDGSKLTGKYYRNGESSPYDTFTISKPTTISSFKMSTANKVNITNQSSPQNISGQLSGNQTASKDNQTAENRGPDLIKDRKNIILPDLSQILNRSKSSENKVVNGANDQKGIIPVPVLPKVPKSVERAENKVANGANTSLSEPIVTGEKQNTVKSEPKNILPSAVVGRNQISIEGSKVILDGSDSTDKDGKIQSYKWQQIGGPRVKLDNANNPKAVFLAPPVTRDTILIFKLTVADDKGSLDTAVTAIKVINDDQKRSSTSPNILELPTSKAGDHLIEGNITNSTGQ